MDLKSLRESGIKKTKVLFLIHGETKVGKSSLAATIPDSVMVCVEREGADRIDHPHKYTYVPDTRTFEKMLRAIASLPEQTVVIDNITFLDKMVKSEVLKQNHIKSLSEMGHGKAYEKCETRMETLIAKIMLLKTKHDKNVVILGHTKAYSTFDIATQDDVMELSVAMTRPRNAEHLTRLVDGTFYFTMLKSSLDTKGKKVSGDSIKLKKSGRVLYLNKRAGVVCGTNLRGLKDSLKFMREKEYKNFWKEIEPHIKASKKKSKN